MTFFNRLLQQRWLAPFLAAVGGLIVLNPNANLDIVVLSGALLIAGHALLKEKLLLVFLVIRPALDYWRDIPLLEYRDTIVNVNAALALLFLLWSLFILFQYRTRIGSAPMGALLPALAALMLASSLWSVAPFTTMIESIKFVNLTLLFLLSFLFVRTKTMEPRELLAAIVVSAIIPLSVGVFQLIAQTGITTFDVRGRIY